MLAYTHFKYCPACSSENISSHSENALHCGACGFIYYHNCSAAVGVIIETTQGILLLKRADDPGKGFYDLPGGFSGYRESLEDTARREIYEELHIQLGDLNYLGSFPNRYDYKSVTYFTCDAIFVARYSGKVSDIRLNNESMSYAILKPDKIDLKLIAFESIAAAIKEYVPIRR